MSDLVAFMSGRKELTSVLMVFMSVYMIFMSVGMAFMSGSGVFMKQTMVFPKKIVGNVKLFERFSRIGRCAINYRSEVKRKWT